MLTRRKLFGLIPLPFLAAKAVAREEPVNRMYTTDELSAMVNGRLLSYSLCSFDMYPFAPTPTFWGIKIWPSNDVSDFRVQFAYTVDSKRPVLIGRLEVGSDWLAGIVFHLTDFTHLVAKYWGGNKWTIRNDMNEIVAWSQEMRDRCLSEKEQS